MSRTRLPGWAARSVVVGSAVVLAAAVAVPAASAQGAPLAEPVVPAKVDASKVEGKLSPRLSAAQGPVTAFVELAKKPAVDAFKAEQSKGKEKAKQAAKAAKADTLAAVNSVVGQLKAADASTKLVTQTANAVPGAVVTADAAKIRDLAPSS